MSLNLPLLFQRGSQEVHAKSRVQKQKQMWVSQTKCLHVVSSVLPNDTLTLRSSLASSLSFPLAATRGPRHERSQQFLCSFRRAKNTHEKLTCRSLRVSRVRGVQQQDGLLLLVLAAARTVERPDQLNMMDSGSWFDICAM